jgi:hypothetical protein
MNEMDDPCVSCEHDWRVERVIKRPEATGERGVLGKSPYPVELRTCTKCGHIVMVQPR